MPPRRSTIVLALAGTLACTVVGAGLAVALGYARLAEFSDRLEEAALQAATAAARDPMQAAAAARLGFDPAGFPAPVETRVETGQLVDGAGANAFRPSPNLLEAVRATLSTRFDPTGLADYGVPPVDVSAEAVVRRFPIAALSAGSGATGATRLGRTALAAAFGVPEEVVAPLVEATAVISWARLRDGLAREEGSRASHAPADVLRAAAAAQERGRLRDRDALLALADALPDDLPHVRLDRILSVQGLPERPGEADEFDAFGLSGAALTTALARALVAERPVRFVLDRPADSVARMELEFSSREDAPPASAHAIGSAGSHVALPALSLSASATVFGVNLPGVTRIELPLRIDLSGGTAEMVRIACDLLEPERRRIDLRLSPLRADVRVRPMPPAAAFDPLPLPPPDDFAAVVETPGYAIWLRGGALTAPDLPVESSVSAPDFGSTRTARLPVDLAQQIRKAVVDGEVHVSVSEDGLKAASLRDEVQRALSIAGPDVAATLVDVLSAYGLAPGGVTASVQQISCNGVEPVR